MSCDVGEVTESLENEHSLFSKPSLALPTSQLNPQPFRCFTTSQLILQALFRFSYVTGSSLTSPGEPPMISPQLAPLLIKIYAVSSIVIRLLRILFNIQRDHYSIEQQTWTLCCAEMKAYTWRHGAWHVRWFNRIWVRPEHSWCQLDCDRRVRWC